VLCAKADKVFMRTVQQNVFLILNSVPVTLFTETLLGIADFIAIWNAKGRLCLNAHNKNWLKELAKEIPETNPKWEI